MAITVQESGTKWVAGVRLRPTRQRLTLTKILVGDDKNRHVTDKNFYTFSSTSDEKVSQDNVIILLKRA